MIQVTYKDHMGSDLSVVNAARVSFGKERKALGYTSIGGGPSIPVIHDTCLLYTSPSPRDVEESRMPSSA